MERKKYSNHQKNRINGEITLMERNIMPFYRSVIMLLGLLL